MIPKWHCLTGKKTHALWVKINTNGSALGNSGNIRAGGVIRDQEREI